MVDEWREFLSGTWEDLCRPLTKPVWTRKADGQGLRQRGGMQWCARRARGAGSRMSHKFLAVVQMTAAADPMIGRIAAYAPDGKMAVCGK